jgi:hypothetical protein
MELTEKTKANVQSFAVIILIAAIVSLAVMLSM